MKNRTNSCKKWLAVLLSVSMLPTAILQNGSMAYAEEKKQEEAVNAEEALEDREADIVVEEISISNKEEFLKYVQRCQDDYYSYGRIFNLQDDIDLSGSSFDGIPYFAGTFNGNGHTVSGLKISREGSDYGFFRYVGKTGRVKDLTVSGSVKVTGSAENVGGVVGTNYGILENCSFEGIVTGNTNVGGIVGENRADGYAVYKIRENAFHGGTKLSAADGFLQYVMERLLSSSAPEQEDEDEELDESTVDTSDDDESVDDESEKSDVENEDNKSENDDSEDDNEEVDETDDSKDSEEVKEKVSANKSNEE